MEPKEAFLARVMEKQGLSKAARTLTQKLERKRLDAAQIEKELSVRKAEKWMSVGSGVMGLFAGRRSSVTSVTRVLSSHRQQGGAESKLEDLRLEIAQLTQQVAQLDDVDERRLQEQLCLPRAGDVTILKLALAFIVP